MPWSARTLKRIPSCAGPAFLAAFVLCFVGWGASQGCRKPPASDRVASDFALKDLAGKPWRLGDLRGKVVLIDFWATWCGPCQESIPYYEGIYERHRSKGLVVLGVSEDAFAQEVAAFVRDNRMTYPVLLDADNQAYDGYDIQALPSTFLIDGDGKIRNAWVGFDDEIARDVEKSIMGLLSAPKS